MVCTRYYATINITDSNYIYIVVVLVIIVIWKNGRSFGTEFLYWHPGIIIVTLLGPILNSVFRGFLRSCIDTHIANVTSTLFHKTFANGLFFVFLKFLVLNIYSKHSKCTVRLQPLLQQHLKQRHRWVRFTPWPKYSFKSIMENPSPVPQNYRKKQL